MSTDVSHPVKMDFEQLVVEIKGILGPSSGLTSEDVEVEELIHCMDGYKSEKGQWSKYAIEDETIAYTRNLVDEGNGNANLLILVWTPGKGSAIHDHGNAHCVMKILQGQLTETRYEFPNGDTSGPMTLKSEQVYKENQTAYMADELGLHRIWNQGSDYAVSLHLYTPPNVAKHGCNVFDGSTGKKKHVQCGYHSVFGRVLEEGEEYISSILAAKAA